jgi:hypothetical protein
MIKRIMVSVSPYSNRTSGNVYKLLFYDEDNDSDSYDHCRFCYISNDSDSNYSIRDESDNYYVGHGIGHGYGSDSDNYFDESDNDYVGHGIGHGYGSDSDNYFDESDNDYVGHGVGHGYGRESECESDSD